MFMGRVTANQLFTSSPWVTPRPLLRWSQRQGLDKPPSLRGIAWSAVWVHPAPHVVSRWSSRRGAQVCQFEWFASWGVIFSSATLLDWFSVLGPARARQAGAAATPGRPALESMWVGSVEAPARGAVADDGVPSLRRRRMAHGDVGPNILKSQVDEV